MADYNQTNKHEYLRVTYGLQQPENIIASTYSDGTKAVFISGQQIILTPNKDQKSGLDERIIKANQELIDKQNKPKKR